MSVVTLTTDFGSTDYYVGVLKGAMLCQNSTINLVDISHNIKNYDIVQASYVIKNTYQSFPKGTIHLVSVNNFYSKNKRFIAIKQDGNYFIGPDNGVFSLIFEEMPKQVYELDYEEKGTFPLKNVYANAVGHIVNDMPFHEIGMPVKKIVQRITLQPVISKSQIRGSIIHIDNYENAIVNISKDLFKRVQQKRNFSLYFKRYNPITELSEQYYDVPVGEVLCLFNSAGYLEIAVHMGRAASLLGLKIDDTVQIDFH